MLLWGKRIGTVTIMAWMLVVMLGGCGKVVSADGLADDESMVQTQKPGDERNETSDSSGWEASQDGESDQKDSIEQTEETEAAEVTEEREPVDHPAAFNPQQVRVGDRVAGLEVKDIRIGDDPYHYVIVELDGQLQVTGTYTQVNDMWIFKPDAPERELLPHVEGQQVRHYREDVLVPRITTLRLRNMQTFGVDPTYVRVGRATVVLEDYKVQYVPEVNWNNSNFVMQDNIPYLDLGDQLIESGSYYVEDTAKLVSIVADQRYHELEPGVLKDAGADARPGSIGIWQDLDISLDLMAAWDADNDVGMNYEYLIGNHANSLQMEEIQLPNIGDAMLFIVERDKWDETINFYNGFEYEYWIVVLREMPDVRLEGEDYRYAFCLIGYSDELILGAEEWMKQLAAYWRVPPEDFYMAK